MCMLVGASTFAYTVGAICSIVASFGEESKEYEQNVVTLSSSHQHPPCTSWQTTTRLVRDPLIAAVATAADFTPVWTS